jgi:DNA replication protein DnaC
VLEPPYLQKPFLGRAIELRELVLTLGRKRQKEVRLVTLTGKPGVGKTNLAIAAAGHLYERRWFPDG